MLSETQNSVLNVRRWSNQVTGPVLRIVNAMVRDRGMYICSAENAGGLAQASAIIEVERTSMALSNPIIALVLLVFFGMTHCG